MDRPRPDRLEVVDSLRGFALFGVYAANLFIFSGFIYLAPEASAALTATRLDRAARFAELLLVENKFMGLFAMLFGVSFWLFASRAEARGDDGHRLFFRRIGWLFAIGAVHGWLLWCFDILRFYALWGAFLPLFRRLSLRALVGSALAAAILVPAIVSGLRAAAGIASDSAAIDAATYAAFANGDSRAFFLFANWRYDWFLTLSTSQIGYQVAVFGRLLLGLAIARAALFEELPRNRARFGRAFVLLAPAGLALNALFAGGALEVLHDHGGWGAFASRFVEETGFLALSCAYAAGFGWIFAGGPSMARSLARAMAPLGRMALTFYLLQTLLGLYLFYGFLPGPKLMGSVGPAALWAFAIVGYAVQLGLAALWLSHFRFGPVEWLWRSLTYGTGQPMRIREARALDAA